MVPELLDFNRTERYLFKEMPWLYMSRFFLTYARSGSIAEGVLSVRNWRILENIRMMCIFT